MRGELSQRARDIWVIPCQHTIKSVRDIYLVFYRIYQLKWKQAYTMRKYRFALQEPNNGLAYFQNLSGGSSCEPLRERSCSARQPALCPVQASQGDLYEKLSERRTKTRNVDVGINSNSHHNMLITALILQGTVLLSALQMREDSAHHRSRPNYVNIHMDMHICCKNFQLSQLALHCFQTKRPSDWCASGKIKRHNIKTSSTFAELTLLV